MISGGSTFCIIVILLAILIVGHEIKQQWDDKEEKRRLEEDQPRLVRQQQIITRARQEIAEETMLLIEQLKCSSTRAAYSQEVRACLNGQNDNIAHLADLVRRRLAEQAERQARNTEQPQEKYDTPSVVE